MGSGYRNGLRAGKLHRFAAAALVFAILFCAFGCDFSNPSVPQETPEGPAISLSQTSLLLEIGETAQLSAQTSDGSSVLWVSSLERVAAVDQNGAVTGVSLGRADISAISGGTMVSCSVTVTGPAESGEVFLPITSMRLKVGETYELPAFSDTELQWETSSPEIVGVEGGTLLGRGLGAAEITARAGGSFATCVVTVSAEDTVTLTLERYRMSVREGESFPLAPVASDGAPITWMVGDPCVQIVNGVLRGVSVGTSTVDAWTAYASMRFQVTVRPFSDPYKDGYEMIWNDEFSGDSLDPEKWGYMNGVQDHYGDSWGPMFWGNDELQYYTEDAVTLHDGALVITAARQEMPNGREYSSARIHTRDKGYWKYGYFEARMQTPAQTGMWPAFWMLPQPASSNNSGNQYGGWPENGEIDIMEAKGRLKNRIDTTLHYGGPGYRNQSLHGVTSKVSGTTEDWHTYGLEWTESFMTWYIDGYPVLTMKSSEWWTSSSEKASAPFDVEFFLLINLAVGGQYDQYHRPDEDFTSAEMRVDYVRVYRESDETE